MRDKVCIAEITTADTDSRCLTCFTVIFFEMGRTDQTIMLLFTDMHFVLTKVARLRTTFLLLLMMVQRTPWC